jgi:hypothetical protein
MVYFKIIYENYWFSFYGLHMQSDKTVLYWQQYSHYQLLRPESLDILDEFVTILAVPTHYLQATMAQFTLYHLMKFCFVLHNDLARSKKTKQTGQDTGVEEMQLPTLWLISDHTFLFTLLNKMKWSELYYLPGCEAM